MSEALPLPTGRTAAWKWWVCVLLLLATMINYMDRMTLNQLVKEINDAFGLEARQYGLLESAFGTAFALGAIVFGWLADRYNPRWIYALAVLAWSAAGFATGLAHTFEVLLICRFCLGFAEAGNWPNALKTTQRILTPAQRTMGNSILQSGAAVGAVLTPLIVLPVIKYADDWRPAFKIIGAIGLVWIACWLIVVRSRDLAAAEHKAAPSLMPILGLLIALIAVDFVVHQQFGAGSSRPKSPEGVILQRFDDATVWLPLACKTLLTIIGIVAVTWWTLRSTAEDAALDRRVFLRRFLVCAVLVVAINATWHFLRAWLPPFLRYERNFSQDDLAWFTAGYYLSTDLGSLAAGFGTLAFARRLSVHSSRVTVFGLAAIVVMLCAIVPSLPSGWPLLTVLFTIGFGALALFPPYYSFTQDLSVQHQGKVTGSLGCINWLMMALMQEAVGEAVTHMGSYAGVIPVMGFIPLVGLIVMLLFWGTTKKEMPSEPPA